MSLNEVPTESHRNKQRAGKPQRRLNRDMPVKAENVLKQDRQVEITLLIEEARESRKKFRQPLGARQIEAWIRRGRP
jgi:hypothetical protein